MPDSEECRSKPEKPAEPTSDPTIELFETADFSASTDRKLLGDFKLAGDAFATQVSEPTDPSVSHSSGESDSLPTDIPGFIVESELGRGAFGVVYAARDELLDRKVAIKKPLISDPAHRQQYIDEARKAVRLDHPGIVPIYQVGMTGGQEPFVVQKLIVGTNLRRLLSSTENRLSIAQIVDIMRQVAMAVDAAHSAGIVHRDLKPENLLIDPEGRVYVADFGLAILDEEDQSRKGREVAGTPFYMSPEQFVGRIEWLDGRSDIWALGVILYELLSGKTPFRGKTLSELKDQVNKKDPRPIHQRDPNIPSGFDAIFRKCCAKNVADRYSSIRELIVALDSMMESESFIEAMHKTTPAGSVSTGHRTSAQGSGQSTQGNLTLREGTTQRKDLSTIRTSIGRATIRNPAVIWSLLGPMITTLATLGAIVGVAWYLEWGPFVTQLVKTSDTIPAEGGTSPDSNGGNEDGVDSKPNEIPNAGTLAKEPLPPPSKPYRVSIRDDGTHTSIAAAIRDSSEGDTITIIEGTYRESFAIDRKITLKGEGKVQISAKDSSCVTIQADGDATIENMSFDCQISQRNTIEIESGRLQIKNCEVYASSPNDAWDCINVKKNATLVADQCHFQTKEHAAINGEEGSTIVLTNSQIRFSGNQPQVVDNKVNRNGVKAKQARGLIQNCTIVGPCGIGIAWDNCVKETLTIEACQFENCLTGILLTKCEHVNIKGISNKPCEIIDVEKGISLNQCKAEIERVSIQGAGVGMEFDENSEVVCVDCDIRGVECGVTLSKSLLRPERLSVRDSRLIGICVGNGTIEGGDLELSNVNGFGMVVLSTNSKTMLSSISIRGNQLKEAVGIYASSGETIFEKAELLDCECGICIDPSLKILNQIAVERTESSDLKTLLKKFNSQNLPLPVVSGDRLTFQGCVEGWIFRGIGTSKIKNVEGDLPTSRHRPTLVGDNLVIEDAEGFNFVVREK